MKAGLFGRTIGGMPKPKGGKGAAPGAARPKGVVVEHRIGIQAPAEVIWDLIYDLGAWHRWNPLYPKAAGEIRLNSVLDLTLALPGRPQQEIHPVVMEWVPNEQLHWRLTLMGGLVKTVRYLEIEQLAEASCILSNGEIFGGFLGPQVPRQMGGNIRRGFIAMNEALKDQAEKIWSDRQG